MDAVRCPGCGSTDLKRKGSGFVCSWCGSTFFTTDSRAEDDYVLEDCMQDIENKHYRKALSKARKGIRLFPDEFQAWYLYTGCLCLTDGTPGDIKKAPYVFKFYFRHDGELDYEVKKFTLSSFV